VEARLAGALLDRFGRVVGAATLMRAGWPGEPASRGKLDVRIHRLRRRLVPLGLEVKTVRQRGWLLAAIEVDGAGEVDLSDPEPGFQRDVTVLKHHQDRRETPAF
jgi:DNA-binding winged helix-turn-helix (wHTH) protein